MRSAALRKVVLCVLDGWGWREQREGNAVALAHTPTFDRLWQCCPRGLLEAAGEEVGLPSGQIGNSEVGHMNLGAGRVVVQDLPMIDRSIRSGDLANHPALGQMVAALHASGGHCHLLGLLSPGGVHSHQEHILALADLLTSAEIPAVAHLFTDGRDVSPQSAAEHLEYFMGRAPDVTIASLIGRYYAMDRDQRWERVAQAYAAMVDGEGARYAEPMAALRENYQAGFTDEFIRPCVIGSYRGMLPGDGLLMANFRADRVRQLLAALTDPDFTAFQRSRTLSFAAAVGMKDYSSYLSGFWQAIFPSHPLSGGLGETIAQAGWHQLRLAESEKYPHVTFFFNGGYEPARAGEERIMIPSPKVATYDLQPEMSAREVTDQLVRAITSARFDLIVVNYANPDMVGHSGRLEAAVKAVEEVDRCLARAVSALEASGATMLLTADHGNCELMTMAGRPHTAHTTSPVPVLLLNGPAQAILGGGRLADVAPTILSLMGHPQPALMSGHSLLLE